MSTPTLGTLANQFRRWKDRGVARGSMLYVVDRVWPDREGWEEQTARSVKQSTMDMLTDQLLEKLRMIGPERVTLDAQLTKLQDEVDEVKEAANDHDFGGSGTLEILKELADVVIVCTTAARVLGYTSDALDLAVLQKAARNAQRDWFPTASGTARHTPEEAGE